MDLASIVIPHYRTPDALDLCLGCIAHYTDAPHEVIVVDNGSEDATLERLRSRQGIELLERRQDPNRLDQDPHKAALDAGIERAKGRYIVALHSDTFVLRPGWLPFLVGRLEEDGLAACGPTTHRLYPVSRWRRWLRSDRDAQEEERIRPVFTVYRREIFETLRFSDFSDLGELTTSLAARGKLGLLSRAEAAHWAYHAGGTTRLTLLDHRRKARRRKARQLQRLLARPEIRQVLQRARPGA